MNKKIQNLCAFYQFFFSQTLKCIFYDFFEAKDAKHHFFYSQILRSCPWMTWQQAHLFGVVKCSSWVPFKDLLKFPVSWINRQFKWMSFYKRRENLEKTLSRSSFLKTTEKWCALLKHARGASYSHAIFAFSFLTRKLIKQINIL